MKPLSLKRTRFAIAVGLGLAALTACGGDGDSTPTTTTPSASTVTVAATTTSPVPVTTAQRAQQYQDAVSERIAPCLDVSNSLSTTCAAAISSTVVALDEFQAGLSSGFPTTRAKTHELIANLEYWRDVCTLTDPMTSERTKCLAFLPVAGKMEGLMFAW